MFYNKTGTPGRYHILIQCFTDVQVCCLFKLRPVDILSRAIFQPDYDLYLERTSELSEWWIELCFLFRYHKILKCIPPSRFNDKFYFKN